MSKSIFTELDYEILESLINFIKENKDEPKTITYKELVKRVNDSALIPVNMGSHLGTIGEAINFTGHLIHPVHPPIPNSLVVNGGTGVAGDGYEPLMKSIGKVTPDMQAIYDYGKWDLVLELAKDRIGKSV